MKKFFYEELKIYDKTIFEINFFFLIFNNTTFLKVGKATITNSQLKYHNLFTVI